MSREKQIEEMAKLICTYPQCIHHSIIGECANTECQTVYIAENLYNEGYRRASDVAEEILTEIETLLNLSKCYGDGGIYFERDIETDIAELKKKYAEDGK